MKKLLVLICLLLLFSSCTLPNFDFKKEVLIKEVERYSGTQIIDTKIYPISIPWTQKINNYLLNKGSLHAGMGNGYIDVSALQVQSDFNEGKFYWENSYYVTNNSNIIDLSSFVGVNSCEVLIYIKWISYGKRVNIPGDEDGSSSPIFINFSTPGLNFQDVLLSQGYNEKYQAVWVLTDEYGRISWKQLVYEPYDRVTVNASPGCHIYLWKKSEFWLFAKRDVNIMENPVN